MDIEKTKEHLKDRRRSKEDPGKIQKIQRVQGKIHDRGPLDPKIQEDLKLSNETERLWHDLKNQDLRNTVWGRKKLIGPPWKTCGQKWLIVYEKNSPYFEMMLRKLSLINNGSENYWKFGN